MQSCPPLYTPVHPCTLLSYLLHSFRPCALLSILVNSCPSLCTPVHPCALLSTLVHSCPPLCTPAQGSPPVSLSVSLSLSLSAYQTMKALPLQHNTRHTKLTPTLQGTTVDTDRKKRDKQLSVNAPSMREMGHYFSTIVHSCPPLYTPAHRYSLLFTLVHLCPPLCTPVQPCVRSVFSLSARLGTGPRKPTCAELLGQHRLRRLRCDPQPGAPGKPLPVNLDAGALTDTTT